MTSLLKIVALFCAFPFVASEDDPKEMLLVACQEGDKTQMMLAISNGADVNAKDMVRTSP